MKINIFIFVVIFLLLSGALQAQAVGSVSVGSETSKETVASLKEKIIDLQNKGELEINKFTLCSNIIGYGQYVPITNNKVKAGGKVYFYYEPVNLFTNRKDGIYGLWFTQDMIVKSQDGTELLNSQNALNFNYQGVSPVMDVYATNSLELGNLPPGIYQFIVVVKDKYRNRFVSYCYNFEIVQ